MINTKLLLRLFDGASIQRWNDHVKPIDFTELDKQAHKAIIAYLIGKHEEIQGKEIEWEYLIYGILFEYMQRIFLTDIKSPVYYALVKDKKKEVNEYLLKAYKTEIADDDIYKMYESYLRDEDKMIYERRILRASHYLATNWEFKIIYNCAPFIYGIENTKKEIENQIEEHYDLNGVQKIMLQKKSYGFVDLCGQLRFQVRWSQTPRIPKTSVLGHMLIVALYVLLFSSELNGDKKSIKRIYNNFFSALFHDLPEVLTRDIIGPVKRGIHEFETWLDGYERKIVEQQIAPLLPREIHDEFRYLVYKPFTNKYVLDSELKESDNLVIPDEYTGVQYKPRDGAVIKIADELAAYLEALKSEQHGIKSPHLDECITKMTNKYADEKTSLYPELAKLFKVCKEEIAQGKI